MGDLIYLKENLLIAWEGIVSNKVRALLTMLGIIIGIGAVIAIVTVGNAMADSVSESMSKLGVTNVLVALQNKNSTDIGLSFLSGSLTESDLISDDMIEKYSELFKDNIEAISLSNVGGAGQAGDGKSYANVTLLGVNEGYETANNVSMLEGRFIRENDLKSRRYVAVVSDKFVNNLFPSNPDCLGKEIKIDTSGSIQTFTIIGVYQYEPPMMATSVAASDKELRTFLYIPISTVNMITSADEGYLAITVNSKSNINMSKFSTDTRDFFNAYYTKNPKFEVSAISLDSMLSIVSDVMGTLSVAVSVIAGISLVVGGIGIMNIMLVSVTERTKEIGMRKALGARNLSIQIQFIVEAVIVSGLGGIIGALLGFGLGFIGSSLLGHPKFPSVGIIVISVLFSMLIGIFFGFYPANKAANLEPVEALRYE
ncbi:MAG: ABC transporter permease [Clostridiales bacterium]|nr:ABC transporter permease [Clostridiales bacterium]